MSERQSTSNVNVDNRFWLKLHMQKLQDLLYVQFINCCKNKCTLSPNIQTFTKWISKLNCYSFFSFARNIDNNSLFLVFHVTYTYLSNATSRMVLTIGIQKKNIVSSWDDKPLLLSTIAATNMNDIKDYIVRDRKTNWIFYS